MPRGPGAVRDLPIATASFHYTTAPYRCIMDEIKKQRAYYAASAAEYDQAHINDTESEHEMALDILSGLLIANGYKTVLDVGSGTGRGIQRLASLCPKISLTGIEPVAELRSIGHGKGIAESALIEGDATAIQFEDRSFDCVMALGVMHHIPKPRNAIAEMLRVSRRAVFISDLNNFGCGSLGQRILSHSARAIGLWPTVRYVKNGFKPWKYSEGDGVHYSYSLFDDIPFLGAAGARCHLFTTKPTGRNPFWTCSHVAVLAIKE